MAQSRSPRTILTLFRRSGLPSSDALRRQVFEAFKTRAYPKNEGVLRNMMQTRYEIATLLGYKSWADYNAADKMIDSGAKIGGFIEESIARRARRRIENSACFWPRRSKPSGTDGAINAYETSYLSELVRRSKYDFDSQSVRAYLPFQRVKQGILDTAAALFHLSFREEQGAPAWAPGVETWDVFDGVQAVGRFYLDMHPRPGKYSHAEMAQVLDGVRGKQLPEAALVCNFPLHQPKTPA